jgi:membrane protein
MDLRNILALDRLDGLKPLQQGTAHQKRMSPLWLDLLVATGLVGLTYALERYLRPASRQGSEIDLDVGTAPEPGADSSGRDRSTDVSIQGAPRVRRGRSASSPTEIPAAGWKDIAGRVYGQLQEDRLLAVAAGAVFYMLLALFPALTALVSLYGLFADPTLIDEHLSLLAGMMPEAAITIIREQVTRIARTSSNALSLGFLFGLGLALWSANAGMKAIIDALNVVYDEPEKRGFIKLTLVAFAFTLGGLAFVIVALGAVVVAPLILAWLGLESRGLQIVSLLRWPGLFLIVLLWLAILYRFAPSRTNPRWEWLSVGSLVAAVAWLAGSALFSWYLSNFANYDATYGSLGAAIGLMMWLWLSVIVILIGGELNAEIEHQTAQDTTTGPERPRGERGAVMADTVGEVWQH